MQGSVEISDKSRACPECEHTPFNFSREFYTGVGRKWYCDDCHTELQTDDVPMSIHGNWVIVAR